MGIEQYFNRDAGDETLDLFSDLDPELRAKKRLEALANPSVRRLYELDTPSFPEDMKSKSFSQEDSVISRLQNSSNIEPDAVNKFLDQRKVIPTQLEDKSNLPQLKQAPVEQPASTFDNLPVKSYFDKFLSSIQPSNKPSQGLTTANDDSVFSAFPQIDKSRKDMLTDNLLPKKEAAIDATSQIPFNNEVRLPSSIDQYDNLIQKYAKLNNVDPQLAKGILQAESSGGNPNKFKGALVWDADDKAMVNAQGPWQILPSVARKLGLKNPNDAEQSTEAAMRLLGTLSKQFQGDPEKIAAAYTAGPRNVLNAIADANQKAKEGNPYPNGWRDSFKQFNPRSNQYIDKVKNNIFLNQPFSVARSDQTIVSAKGTKTQEPSTSQIAPPATEQSSKTTAVPINGDSGVVAAPQASGKGLVKEDIEEKPDYMKMLEEAQNKEGIKELGYGLTTAGTTIGSAIAGVTPDYKGLEAIKTGTNLVDQLKTKMTTDKASKELAEESEFNDPGSSTSKFVWSMVKQVYPDLVSKLEAAGITNPSAKQLQKMGVDVSKFTTATMRNRADELKQQYRLTDKAAKAVTEYEEKANPLSTSARQSIGREVARLKTAQHALQLLAPFAGDLNKVPIPQKMSFIYEMASTLSPTGNPRSDIIDHLNIDTVNDKFAQTMSELFSTPSATHTKEFMQNYKSILEGQMQRAQKEIVNWQDSRMLAYLEAHPDAHEAIQKVREKHDRSVFDEVGQKYNSQGTEPINTQSLPKDNITSNNKSTPNQEIDPIDEYSKKYNIPYNQAKAIIEKRKGKQ